MAGNTSTIDRLFAEGFLSADDKMLQTFAHPADEEEMGDNIERIGQAAGAASAVFQSFMRHGLLGFDAPSGPQGISLRLYCADSRMGCVDFSDRLDVQTVGPKDGWERDFVDEVAFLVVNSSLAIKGKIEPRKLSQQSPTHLASPPASPSSCTYSPNVRMACGNHDTIASISQLCSNSISSKKAVGVDILSTRKRCLEARVAVSPQSAENNAAAPASASRSKSIQAYRYSATRFFTRARSPF